MVSTSKTAKGETAKEKMSTAKGMSFSFTRSGKVVGIGVLENEFGKMPFYNSNYVGKLSCVKGWLLSGYACFKI